MEAGTQKIDILLVDDNEIFLQAFSKLLAEICGSNIRSIDKAHSGTEAIDCVHHKNYGLIFMDIDMPNCGGVATTQALCTESIKRNIVALSFYDNVFMQEQMIFAGASRFVAKDKLNPEILTEIVDSCVIS